MSEKLELVVAMPVFNESEGIIEFLNEIRSNFIPLKIGFVLVDDDSTDSTATEIEEFIKLGGISVRLVKNETNVGHGPSTIKAIDEALMMDTLFIMTVDGDGQFHGHEMRQLYECLIENDFEVMEGVRMARSDPMFRKITSFATRLLVFLRCHKFPKDANTPLRIYKSSKLFHVRNELGTGCLTPNLHISSFIRSRNCSVRLGTMNVHSIPRRGLISTGTMWKSRRQSLPSKRFIKFLMNSTWQWITTSSFFKQSPKD